MHRTADGRGRRGRRRGRRKPTLEPPPADALGVQQVADILAGRYLYCSLAGGSGAAQVGATIVERRVGIAGNRNQRARCRDRSIRERKRDHGIAGLSRDEIDGTYSRRAEHAAVRIVVQRVVLSIIPHPGDRVAVKIRHHCGSVASAADADTPGSLDELVHQPAVEGLLLVGIIVIHVTGVGLRTIETIAQCEVRIVGQQSGGDETVDGRRVVARDKAGFARRVRGEGVGPEIMVEADILKVDDYDVLNRRLRPLVVGNARHRSDAGEDSARGESGEFCSPGLAAFDSCSVDIAPAKVLRSNLHYGFASWCARPPRRSGKRSAPGHWVCAIRTVR
jgi:hypothetical protein